MAALPTLTYTSPINRLADSVTKATHGVSRSNILGSSKKKKSQSVVEFSLEGTTLIRSAVNTLPCTFRALNAQLVNRVAQNSSGQLLIHGQTRRSLCTLLTKNCIRVLFSAILTRVL